MEALPGCEKFTSYLRVISVLRQPNSIQYRDSALLIVFRYLARELLYSWLAISGILLLIVVSGRFIRYLEQVAVGELKAEFLFTIMGYRMPGFLEMIMPLALLIAILLTHGRLHMNSEMTVLEACGMSQHQLLGYTMTPALLVALVVGLFSIWLTPAGTARMEDLLNRQDNMTEFDNLTPGRFQMLNGGNRTTYVEELLDDKSTMHHVFIALPSEEGTGQGVTMLLAEQGHLHPDRKSGKRYLILSDGYRYDLMPGQPRARIMKYEMYGVQMQDRNISDHARKESVQPTSVLLSHNNNVSKAELQWRISLPLLIPVIVLMALPLARVHPRQGRFAKLLPGVLLYLLYLALLIVARSAVRDGKLLPAIGVWVVHAAFLTIAVVMFYRNRLTPWLFGRRFRKS